MPIIETYIPFAPPAATAELEKTGKGLMAHKCGEYLLFACLSDWIWHQRSRGGHQVAP